MTTIFIPTQSGGTLGIDHKPDSSGAVTIKLGNAEIVLTFDQAVLASQIITAQAFIGLYPGRIPGLPT